MKDSYSENYLLEAEGCASASPAKPCLLQLCTHIGDPWWWALQAWQQQAPDVSQNTEQTFFLKSILALSLRSFSKSEHHASKSETEKAEIVQVLLELLGSGSSFLHNKPPRPFLASLEPCCPWRRLFLSCKADVSGISYVEPLWKGVEHHPSQAAAPHRTFPPPFPLYSTTKSNPVTETIALSHSRGFSRPLQPSREVQNASQMRPDSNTM